MTKARCNGTAVCPQFVRIEPGEVNPSAGRTSPGKVNGSLDWLTMGEVTLSGSL